MELWKICHSRCHKGKRCEKEQENTEDIFQTYNNTSCLHVYGGSNIHFSNTCPIDNWIEMFCVLGKAAVNDLI